MNPLQEEANKIYDNLFALIEYASLDKKQEALDFFLLYDKEKVEELLKEANKIILLECGTGKDTESLRNELYMKCINLSV